MTFFEFLMVLIGLVGAIAISLLLTYLGHLIRHWNRVTNPFLFILLCVWMLINVIGHITGIWAYRDVSLDVYTATFIIIAPIILFTIATTTLIPSHLEDKADIDLDSVYFSSSRPVFVFLALHTFTALIADFLPGVTGAPPVLFMMTMTGLLVLCAFSKSKQAHIVLLLLLVASQAMPNLIQ